MYIFNWFAVLSLGTAMLYFSLGMVVLLRGAKSLANWIFTFSAITMTIWGIGEGMGRAAVDPQLALFWFRYVVAIGSSFYGAFLVHFWLVLSGRKSKASVMAMAASFYVASTVLLVFRIWHPEWFIRGVAREYWGYSAEGTRWYIGYMGYIFTCSATVVIVAFRDARRAIESLKRQYQNIGIAILATIVVAFVTQILRPVIHLEIPEMTVASSLIFIGYMAYIVSRYGILTITGKMISEDIITTMEDMVIAVDKNFNISYINFSILRHLGYEEGELMYKPLNKILVGDFSDNTSESFIKNLPMSNREAVCMTKSGGRLAVSANASLLRGGLDDYIGFVFVLRDMSKLGELVRDLQQKTAELEESKIKLEKTVLELERFNGLVVDRELAMVELKKKLSRYETA
jgi:PAS domain S-box-containing protein